MGVFKSAGPDENHSKVVKELTQVIVETLAFFSEISWKSSEVLKY